MGTVKSATGFITTTEAAERAGCSYRQLDHWITHGVFDGTRSPGSGHARSIPESLIPAITVVARVAFALRTAHVRSSIQLLRLAALDYQTGRIELSQQVALTWEVTS